MDYLMILIAGFGGGVVRGLVGYIKHQFAYKNVKFDVPYFFTMMFLSGAIGLLVAASITEISEQVIRVGFSSAIAFIAGYAGGDFLENIYKIIIKKPKN